MAIIIAEKKLRSLILCHNLSWLSLLTLIAELSTMYGSFLRY